MTAGERRAGGLHLLHHIFAAIGHDRALALRHLLRRIRPGLHLHNVLLPELFEVIPPEVAHQLGSHQSPPPKGRRHEEVIEILEAIVLAIVAVATAWSG